MKGCYLIHFDTPYTSPNGAKVIQHYLGWGGNIAKRLRTHQAGTGARVMQVVTDAGVPWRCVRRWKDATRQDERRFKRWHHHALLCPVCRKAGKAGAA